MLIFGTSWHLMAFDAILGHGHPTRNRVHQHLPARAPAHVCGASGKHQRIRLIRADQKRRGQEKLEALLIEGLESGAPIEVTPEYWASLRAEAREHLKRKGT
jgi:hypothetical protein